MQVIFYISLIVLARDRFCFESHHKRRTTLLCAERFVQINLVVTFKAAVIVLLQIVLTAGLSYRNQKEHCFTGMLSYLDLLALMFARECN